MGRSTASRRFVQIAAILIFAPSLIGPGHTVDAKRRDVDQNYLRLPLAFEANAGQTDARVRFIARGPGYTLFLTTDEAVLSLRSTADKDANIRMRLIGAQRASSIAGEGELS